MTFLDPSKIVQVSDYSYDCYECSRLGLLHRDHPITGYAITTISMWSTNPLAPLSEKERLVEILIRGFCKEHDHIHTYRNYPNWTCISKSEYELLQVIQTMLE